MRGHADRSASTVIPAVAPGVRLRRPEENSAESRDPGRTHSPATLGPGSALQAVRDDGESVLRDPSSDLLRRPPSPAKGRRLVARLFMTPILILGAGRMGGALI